MESKIFSQKLEEFCKYHVMAVLTKFNDFHILVPRHLSLDFFMKLIFTFRTIENLIKFKLQ